MDRYNNSPRNRIPFPSYNPQKQGSFQQSPVKNKSYLKIVSIVSVSLIFIFIITFLIVNFWPEKIFSEEDLTYGIESELKLNNEKSRRALLDYAGITYVLRLRSLERGFVKIDIIDNLNGDIIHEEEIYLSKINKIDLDEDGFWDLSIRLRRIREDSAFFRLELISEIVCYENWECGLWNKCASKVQERNCIDLNNCGTNSTRPEIKRSCTLGCKEDWQCSDWGDCLLGLKKRECKDLGECGTLNDLPELQVQC